MNNLYGYLFLFLAESNICNHYLIYYQLLSKGEDLKGPITNSFGSGQLFLQSYAIKALVPQVPAHFSKSVVRTNFLQIQEVTEAGNSEDTSHPFKEYVEIQWLARSQVCLNFLLKVSRYRLLYLSNSSTY